MLRVHGLTKEYDGLVALHRLDVTVETGECVVLVGHNGSGKSTALACMTGRVSASAGHAEFAGRPLLNDAADASVRAAVSYVGDAPAFYPDLSVKEHLLLVALAHGLKANAASEAERLLAELGLGERSDAFPHQLSAGMRQKLQVACGLVRPFDLLVLDEPTQNLDGMAAAWLTDTLAAHKDRGAAVLVASHDPALISELADEVLVLEDGRTQARGTPQQIATNPVTMRAGIRLPS